MAGPDVPTTVVTLLPVAETLRCVWVRHFDRAKDGLDERVQLWPAQDAARQSR